MPLPVVSNAVARLAVVSAANWLFVGEASDIEDASLPFGESATRLFDNMLSALGLVDRDTTFPPLAGGALAAVIAARLPAVIVLMGPAASKGVLGSDQEIAKLRQTEQRIGTTSGAVPVVVTHHPTHLLRHLADKSDAWIDLNRAADAAMAAPG